MTQRGRTADHLSWCGPDLPRVTVGFVICERFVGFVTVLLIAGCGPAVGIDEGQTDGATLSSSTTGVDSGGSSPTPTTAGPSGGVTGGVTTTVPTTTTGSESTGDSELGTSAFLLNPDGGAIHDPCDILSQDCGNGEACRPWSVDGGPVWNSARCSPVPASPDPVGAPCVMEGGPVSGIDSCEEGAMCINVDEDTLAGTCVEFCDAVCADPQDTCVEGNDGFISVCLPQCDPLLQDCQDGETCVGSHGVVEFYCVAPGTPIVDDAQVQPGACGDGRVGVPAALIDGCEEGEPCCTDFCDLSEPMPDCPMGLQCESWVVKGTSPGEQNVGACVSPS